jgi:hypothetical protein
MTVPGSKPDAWDAGFGEGFQKLREPCQWFACKRNEVVNGAVDDRVRRTQKAPQTGSPIVSKIGWQKKATAEGTNLPPRPSSEWAN